MNKIEHEYVDKVYIFICQMTTKYSERIASTLIDHIDPTLHEQPINMMEPCKLLFFRDVRCNCEKYVRKFRSPGVAAKNYKQSNSHSIENTWIKIM